MFLRYSFLFLLLISLSSLSAQQVAVPNLSSSYLTQSYPLFNAASIPGVTNKVNLLLSHKQGIGAFSVFSQNYFNANIRFGSDSLKKHAVGLRVLNDQAGKYIGVRRVALLYSYSLVFSEAYNLSLGVAPTIINYRATAKSGGPSAGALNLDLGLWLNTKKMMLKHAR